MKKFVMYGAGNIGRGFIGQLAYKSGFKTGFVDIDDKIIALLNQRGEYPVNVVTSEKNTETVVKNVYGIDGKNNGAVADEIAACDLMATAVGVNVLKFIAKPIALGLKKRFENNMPPLNIIICENLIGADEFLRELIKKELPDFTDRIDKEIGFVEASIGRMVPVMTDEKRQGNLLRVYVEPYDILPVDKDAFKGEIPEFKNLYPYSPFSLFIQRKLFMHNMSHALCAYLGYLKGYEYIYQAAGDFSIRFTAHRALGGMAAAIAKENGADTGFLMEHASDLLYRFLNRELADTVARVGRDTKRKLSSSDRLAGALNLCLKHGGDYSILCLGIAAGFLFNPEGDDSSAELYTFAKENGVREAALKYCGFDEKTHEKPLKLIETLYKMLKDNKNLDEIIYFLDSQNSEDIKV